MSDFRCALLGHRAMVTDSIVVGGIGNVWHQETCSRCGAKRQYMTHSWGRSAGTPWTKS